MKKSLFLEGLFNSECRKYFSQEKIINLCLKSSFNKLNIKCSEIDFKKIEQSFINHLSREVLSDELSIDIDFPNSFCDKKEELENLLQRIVDIFPEEMDENIEILNRGLSEATVSVVNSISELVTENLLINFDARTEELEKIQIYREEDIKFYWRRELHHLDTLRFILREAYQQAKNQKNGIFSERNKAYAIDFLYDRSFLLIGEIISLLRAGYPDGALARWRSLHELSVVINFLASQKDYCSKLYIQHSIVERLKVLEYEYEKNPFTSKYKHIRKEIEQLKKQRVQLIRQYTKYFCNDYGWAAFYLDKKKVRFSDIEEISELSFMRSKYNRANNTIHAGALAGLTRISLSVNANNKSITKTPPSEGCELPLDFTAKSISILTLPLLIECESIDAISYAATVQDYSKKLITLVSKKKSHINKRKLRGNR